jgi:hypothetical protein
MTVVAERARAHCSLRRAWFQPSLPRDQLAGNLRETVSTPRGPTGCGRRIIR